MKRPIFSRTERRALARFLRKAIGVALIGLGLALTLALFSYDPTDAAVFSAHWKSPNNWLGAPGAVAADILMRIFGVAGYGAAVLTLMWGARIYWRRWISSPLKRVAIAPIALFAAAMFASAHAVSAPGGGGLGGLLGDFGFGVLAEGLPFESAKIRLVVATLIALALAGPALLFAFGADWAALAALHRTARSRTQEAFALLGQRIDVRGGAAAGALFAGAVGVAAARSFRGRPGRTETEPLQRLEPRFEFDEPSAAVSDPIADDESATVPQPPLAAEGRPSAPKWERTRIFPWVSRGGERGPRRAPSEPPLAAAPSAPRGDLVTLANRFRETAPDPIVEPGFADTPKPTTGEVALPEWLAASASDEPPLTNQKASTQQPLSEIDPHQDHEPDDWDAPADPSPEPRAEPIAAIPSAVLSIRDYAEERRRTAAATIYEVGPNARLDADSLESAAEAVAPTTMRRAVGAEPFDYADSGHPAPETIELEAAQRPAGPAPTQPDETSLDAEFEAAAKREQERRAILERARSELTGEPVRALEPPQPIAAPSPKPEPAPAATAPIPADPDLDDPNLDDPNLDGPSSAEPAAEPVGRAWTDEPETNFDDDFEPWVADADEGLDPEDAAPATDPRPAQDQAPPVARRPYQAPSIDLLTEPDPDDTLTMTERMLAEQADRLQGVLNDYGIKGDIIDVHPGPVVTLFELEPAPGLKAARVINLADDIARSMSAVSARISTIPGRNVIGIELPNQKRETVMLRALLAHQRFSRAEGALSLALGKDIAGEPVVANLARMPHLLIAGTTGSGKSVSVNAMILSLLYRLSPAQVRMIMIDPKMLELSVYNNIPHLLAPVVTDPKKAVLALKWAVREMERRYERMAELGVRGIDSYNQRMLEMREAGEPIMDPAIIDPETGEETPATPTEPMPRIVVVVDEMADLMLVAGKEIEHCIQRLAQMARAAGIHLIMATQRPSVDVITGTIKANFPIRISFQVTSKIDSRTILGEQGAEQLLGRGDMLYSAGGARLTRIHGPFVSDEEVEEVAAHLRSFGPPDYRTTFEEASEAAETAQDADNAAGGDADLYDRAVALVSSERKASTSFIQRRLQIGYNRAARIIEMMEAEGVVSPANHVGKREILIGGAD